MVIGQFLSLPIRKTYDNRGRTTSIALARELDRGSDEALSDRLNLLAPDVFCVGPFERLSIFGFFADDALPQRSLGVIREVRDVRLQSAMCPKADVQQRN